MKRAYFIETTQHKEGNLLQVSPAQQQILACCVNRSVTIISKSARSWMGRTAIGIIFMLSVFCGKAQVVMPDMMKPADSWGLIDVNNLYGGFMQVDSYTALQNVRVQFLKRGMLFVVYDVDGDNTNGITTQAYMFLPAAGAWPYNTPFDMSATIQSQTIKSALLEKYLIPVSLGMPTGAASGAALGALAFDPATQIFSRYDGTNWTTFQLATAGIADNSIIASKLQGAGSALANGTLGNVLQSSGDGKFLWGSLTASSLLLGPGQLYLGDASAIPTGYAVATDKIAIPLSGFGAAVAPVSMGGFNITNLAAPANDLDAVTKLYADAASSTGSAGLSAEVTRANAAELLLTNNLISETGRATGAEGTLTISLAAEATRATATELLLTSTKENTANKSNDVTLVSFTPDINFPTQTAVKTYVDLASSTGSTALSTEVTRAIAAEGTLTTDLTKEKSRATTAEGDLALAKENTANKSNDVTLGSSNPDVNFPTQNAVKTYVNAAINTATPDASAGIKGKIQLAGDLAGVGSSAAVPVITNDAIITSKILDANVTYAKMQNIAASSLLGNPTAAATTGSEITLGNRLAFTGNTGNTGYSINTITETFTADIKVTNTAGFGKYAMGQTILATGKTANWVLIDAVTQTIPAIYVKPTVVISPIGSTQEIGSTLNVSLSSVFNQNNGGDVTSTVYSGGGGALSGQTESIAQLTAAVTYTVTVNYVQGTCLNDNQGVQNCTGQIAAGSVTSSCTFTPVAGRYWGRCLELLPTSAEIVATAGGGADWTAGKAKTYTVIANTVPGSESNNVFFAYPSSSGTLTSIIVNSLPSIDAFTRSTVSVTNASGYTQNYNVYVSNNTFSGNVTPIVN
jgi:hypothetical protein